MFLCIINEIIQIVYSKPIEVVIHFAQTIKAITHKTKISITIVIVVIHFAQTIKAITHKTKISIAIVIEQVIAKPLIFFLGEEMLVTHIQSYPIHV